MTDDLLDDRVRVLDVRQQARVEALEEARHVLAPGAASTPDAADLYYLARFIETGDDPWAEPDRPELRTWGREEVKDSDG